MKITQIRAIISTLLILTALLSLSSGTILYFLPYGMWLCFTRGFLNDVHALSGLVMGITILIHFIINRHLYTKEMKNLFFWKKNRTFRI